jgi:hypothetical protein
MENEIQPYDPNTELSFDEKDEESAEPNILKIPEVSLPEAAISAAKQGFTMGYYPEAQAYQRAYEELKSKLPKGQTPLDKRRFPAYQSVLESPEYKQFLEEERSRVIAGKEQYPMTSFGWELAGTVANPATWIAPEVKAGQTLYNIAARGIPAAAQMMFYNEPKKPFEKEDTASDIAMKAVEGAFLGNLGGVLADKVISPAAKTIPETGANLLEAARRLKISGVPIPEIPRYLTTDSSVAKWITEKLAKTPLAGEPLHGIPEKYRTGLEETRSGISDFVNPTMPDQSIYDAGKKLQNDIGSWVESQKQYFNNQYDINVSSVIDDTQRVPLANSGNAISDIVQKRAAIGPGVFDLNRVQDVRDATSGVVKPILRAMEEGRGKSFSEIKNLRTYLRELYGNPANNISESEYRTIYKALSDDMEEAAKLSGASNYNEYKRIDREYFDNINAIDDFQSFFGGFEKRGSNYVFSSTPEQLVGKIRDAMKEGKGGSYDKVRTMMNVLTPEGRDSLRKYIISNLGSKLSPESPNVSVFDPQSFMKEYGSLSKKAKQEVFGNDLSSALDDLYTLSSPFKVTSGKSRMGSISPPSGSEEQAGEIKVGLSYLANPIATIGSIMGGRTFTGFMASPTSVKRIGNLARALKAVRDNPASRGAQAALAQSIRQFPIEIGKSASADDYARTWGISKEAASNIYNSLYGKDEQEATQQSSGGRVARKSGGRTTGNAISAEVKRVRALLSEKTASMLSVPDDAIATALHLAKRT